LAILLRSVLALLRVSIVVPAHVALVLSVNTRARRPRRLTRSEYTECRLVAMMFPATSDILRSQKLESRGESQQMVDLRASSHTCRHC
jgi:hypothetical protein